MTAMEKKDKTLNVPNLRFPEFSGEWEMCTLGDITQNFSLRNKDKIQYPMFSVTNSKGFVPQSEQFEDREMIGEDIKAYKIIREGDFAYNPARINVGSIAKYNKSEPCMISSLYVCFKALPQINNEWLMQLLKTPKMNFYYNVNGEGGVRVYLFYPNFARIRTSYPSLVEQQKIASFLSIIDQRIETQKKIIEDLKKLKDAINNSLHNNINEFQLFSFNELGNAYSGLTGKSSDDFGSGLPYISYLSVFRNDIVTDGPFDCVKVSKTEKQNIVNYGDLLFTLSSETPSEVGIGAIYLGKTNPLYLNSFCFGVHLSNQENIYGPYLAYFITSQYFRRTILPFAQGSTRYNLMKSDFMKHKFCFPNIASQKAIHNTLHTLSEKIQNEEVCLNKYTEQKQYLLTRLFI